MAQQKIKLTVDYVCSNGLKFKDQTQAVWAQFLIESGCYLQDYVIRELSEKLATSLIYLEQSTIAALPVEPEAGPTTSEEPTL